MNKVVIIAEAGVNHNGDMELARKLIDVAVDAGVDYVKFQTFRADKIASTNAGKAEYQKNTTDAAESQLEMLRKLELSYENHLDLIDYCKGRSIQFLSTPFDLESIELLRQLDIKLGKIPSGEITNLPYLEAMAKAFPNIIVSTGMATIEEVEEALKIVIANGTDKKNLTILHCNTEYPTPMENVNLKAMNYIKNKLQVNVGYSDHTLGIEVPVAAVALGAAVIEKHFTLDRSLEGPDHKASLEPSELKSMVNSIRNVEKAIAGSGEKEPSPSELKNIAIARKSIVAACPIREGEVLSEKNLAVKRPGNGLSPMLWYQVCGTKAIKKFDTDELITL